MFLLKFGENVLAETNKNFEMIVDNKADLKGLTDDVIASAAELATKEKKDGNWIFTLQKPSMLPFLQQPPKIANLERNYIKAIQIVEIITMQTTTKKS